MATTYKARQNSRKYTKERKQDPVKGPEWKARHKLHSKLFYENNVKANPVYTRKQANIESILLEDPEFLLEQIIKIHKEFNDLLRKE